MSYICETTGLEFKIDHSCINKRDLKQLELQCNIEMYVSVSMREDISKYPIRFRIEDLNLTRYLTLFNHNEKQLLNGNPVNIIKFRINPDNINEGYIYTDKTSNTYITLRKLKFRENEDYNYYKNVIDNILFKRTTNDIISNLTSRLKKLESALSAVNERLETIEDVQ